MSEELEQEKPARHWIHDVVQKNQQEDKELAEEAEKVHAEILEELKDELDAIEAEEKAKEPDIKLTDEQERVFDLINSGQNVFVTGVAGTGKSVVIREIKKRYPDTDFTGTTGVSAVNIDGITIHSWAGIGLGQGDAVDYANNIIRQERYEKIRTSIRNCDRLVLDEVSMLSAELLEKLDYIFRMVRGEKEKPFGGIQMLFFGDFLQLPPIPRKDEYNRIIPGTGDYTFMSNSWRHAGVANVQLTKVFRQSDVTFVDVLNRIRMGIVTPYDMETLHPRMKVHPPETPRPVVLYPKRVDVDAMNREELNKIDSETVTYHKSDIFYCASEQEQNFYLKELNKSNAPTILDIKVGARVMMLRNSFQTDGIVNGSLGTVIDFTEGAFKLPVVEFDAGPTMVVDKEKWEIRDKKELKAVRSQIPLTLAYALTVHKSQGMTLDSMFCDFAGTFGNSMVYVALSRVKSLEGLYMRNLDPKYIKCSTEAKQFYDLLNAGHMYGYYE